MKSEPNYFVFENDSVNGPFAESEILERLKSQELSPQVLICKEFTDVWISAQQLLPNINVHSISKEIPKKSVISNFLSSGKLAAPKGPFSALKEQWLVFIALIFVSLLMYPILIMLDNTSLGFGKAQWIGLVVGFGFVFIPISLLFGFFAQCGLWFVSLVRKKIFLCQSYTVAGVAGYLIIINLIYRFYSSFNYRW